MMRRLLFLAVLVFVSASTRGESRLLRHPTYSHGRVAFSYLGDLWVANEDGSNVRRLTVHRARDVFPCFSPDGKTIAFSSNREGNYDVYVIPAEGGLARPLTYHSADDFVIGWSPDGKKVIFQSARGAGVFPSVSTLYEVPAMGGMETGLPTDWGSWGSYSPDGTKLAFTRHPGVWSRKHYRGSYAVDLWLLDVASKKFTRLGDDDYKGNYFWPMYGKNGEIYYVADRLPNERSVKPGSAEVMKSAANIWKMSERGGATVQLTHHPDGNLAYPSLSADGRVIVYEEDFGIYKLDLVTGKDVELKFDIKSDVKENQVTTRVINSEADAFSISPSNRRAMVVEHGDLFSIATDRGEVRQVTATPWREQNPQWSPDGKWIAFVSDRTGREEVWLTDERGRGLRQVSDADGDKSAVFWSADGTSLWWAGADKRLRRYEVESAKTEEMASSTYSGILGPSVSPDGKWIAYAKQDELLRSHVYIKPVGEGLERMVVSSEFQISSSAHWTADGKKIVFLGGNGAPAMSSLNRTTMQVYSLMLAHQEKNPEDHGIDSEEQAQSAAERSRPAGAASESTRNKPEVKIDFDGMDRRIKQLTHVTGSVSGAWPSPDGRMVAFVATDGEAGEGMRPALYTMNDDGSHVTAVGGAATNESTAGEGRRREGGSFSDVQWGKESRTLYYLHENAIYSAPVALNTTEDGSTRRSGRGAGGGAASAATSGGTATVPPKKISFVVRLETDHAAERRQVFEEAWRVMKNRFYDPKLHGVDWVKVHDRFEPLLADVADSDDLDVLLQQMIGELNSSHTGVTNGNSYEGVEHAVTHFPGFEVEPDASGYFKISHVYRNGPADHDFVKLGVGDYVLAVGGHEVRTSENYWRYFNSIQGDRMEIMVNSKPEMEGAWTVSIEPVSPSKHADLEYERWVDSRKAMVEKLSGGEVGYLHIRAMDAASLERFKRELLANLTRKALIIDERFNGGGGIDQELLEILNQRKAYQTWRARDSMTITRPVQAFFGPMVVLQNERSASNAEMFPEGFRALGLGQLVGMPTSGAVIGTGTHRLLDGSVMRVPGYGVFTRTGEDLENYGVQPDVRVDNRPEDFLAGRDRQLETAVELLKAQVAPK